MLSPFLSLFSLCLSNAHGCLVWFLLEIFSSLYCHFVKSLFRLFLNLVALTGTLKPDFSLWRFYFCLYQNVGKKKKKQKMHIVKSVVMKSSSDHTSWGSDSVTVTTRMDYFVFRIIQELHGVIMPILCGRRKQRRQRWGLYSEKWLEPGASACLSFKQRRILQH